MIRMVVMAAALLLTGNSGEAADIEMHDGRVRLVPPVADSSAAYFTLRNRSNRPRTLTSITADCCRKVMMHKVQMIDGRMTMLPLPRITIPANGEWRFRPQGDHIMLMGLKQPLRKGDQVTLTLHFANGERENLMLPVRDMR